MKSTTSFINPGVLLNDFKRFTWISIAYLLGLLMTVPLNLFLIYNTAKRTGNQTINYFMQFNIDSSPFELILVIIVPVLTGLFLFRYLHSSQAADMEHSLPIKRETLYNTHILAGLIFLFVPLLITALSTWAIKSGFNIESLSGTTILTWLGICLLFNLLFFLLSAATAMITGMSSVQGILTYILLFLPTGLSVLILHNLAIYVYGFAFDYYVNRIFISPLMRITEFGNYPIHHSQIISYILAAVALYFIGRILYQHRRLEKAGNAMAFDILQPVFKYGVTFCTMLLMGSYYFVYLGMPWTYLGYFLGSILAYFLMEILLNKSFRVFSWSTVKGYGLYSLFAVILIAGMHYDFSGTQQRLPELADVKSIYMGSSFYSLNYREQRLSPNSEYYIYEINYPPTKPIYTDKANIARIHALHRSIINNLDKAKKSYISRRSNEPGEYISLAYIFKDGSHMYRQYSLSAGDYMRFLKPIYESVEYKRFNNKILDLNLADINMLEVHAREMAKFAHFTDPQQIKQAVIILQNEVLKEKYEEMTDHREPWSSIDIRTNDRHVVSLSWNKSYADFERWLKTTGKYKQSRIIPGEDLAYAMVRKSTADGKTNNTARIYPSRLSPRELLAWEQMSDTIKVSNPEQLEVCLRQYTYNRQPDYDIVFLLTNGSSIYGGFTEADAPDFIKGGQGEG
ncbi:MAG: DUF6449 domain-containing protein [Syntrophomonadaceae bacterium]|nr:DUF6449 domain-containing protein [Syntrophomonadaceae bacterium]